MLEVEKDNVPHIVIIEITSSSCKSISEIREDLTHSINLIKIGIISSSINPNVPSDMIGRYSNYHQWIKGETKLDKEYLLFLCKKLGDQHRSKLLLYKYDNINLTRTEGSLWIDLGDPI